MYTITRINNPKEITNATLLERAIKAHGGRSKEFIAKLNNIEAGFLSYEDWQERYQGFIYEIFVLPEFRKQGVATLLLHSAEKYAIQLHCKSIRLKAYALEAEPNTSRLIAWYSRAGYLNTPNEPEIIEKNL